MKPEEATLYSLRTPIKEALIHHIEDVFRQAGVDSSVRRPTITVDVAVDFGLCYSAYRVSISTYLELRHRRSAKVSVYHLVNDHGILESRFLDHFCQQSVRKLTDRCDEQLVDVLG